MTDSKKNYAFAAVLIYIVQFLDQFINISFPKTKQNSIIMEMAIIHFKLIKVFGLKNCYFRKHFFEKSSFLQGENILVGKFNL